MGKLVCIGIRLDGWRILHAGTSELIGRSEVPSIGGAFRFCWVCWIGYVLVR